MKKKKMIQINFEKIRESTWRTSLALVFSLCVFIILLVAVLLTGLLIWLLGMSNAFVNSEGELQLGTVILFMSLISLFLGAVIAFFSSRIPLKPVNEIINKMNRLSAGDFKTRLKFGNTLSSHPAVKELTTSFNKMAEELENTELLRNGFINDFSHEFKTPIVSIAGLANLLEKENLPEEKRLQYVRAIKEESMRLSSMATNVLQLNKIESQTILTDVNNFNLSEQVRSAVLLLEDKWVKKGIDLQLEFDEYDIFANDELLMQVWINLIDNAVKFTDEGGFVGIDITAAEDSLKVRISNTGKEIPEDERAKLFNKFYQGDESHATGGNGIGLAIVKKIVELHHGQIDVVSREGINAFTVILPTDQK